MTHSKEKAHGWESLREGGMSTSSYSQRRQSSSSDQRKNPRTGLPLTEVEILDNAGRKVCIIDVDLNPPRTVDGKSTHKAVFLDKDELGKLLNLGADAPQLVNTAINHKVNSMKK